MFQIEPKYLAIFSFLALSCSALAGGRELTDAEIDEAAVQIYQNREAPFRYGEEFGTRNREALPEAAQRWDILRYIGMELADGANRDRLNAMRNEYRQLDNGEGPYSLRNPDGFQTMYQMYPGSHLDAYNGGSNHYDFSQRRPEHRATNAICVVVILLSAVIAYSKW